MEGVFITTGTVTYAIKGRNVLRESGYNAEIRRITGDTQGVGCGYGVYTNADPETARKIFRLNGVKFK